MHRCTALALILTLSAISTPVAAADCSALRPTQPLPPDTESELQIVANAFKSRLLLRPGPYSAAEVEHDLRALTDHADDAPSWQALLYITCEAVRASDLPLARQGEVLDSLLAVGGAQSADRSAQ